MRTHSLSLATALLLCAGPAYAQTADTVCRDVRHCADILSRHAPDSFDYGVLASEFARFGPRGTSAIKRLADNPDRADNAFALATRPEAPVSLKAALLQQWPAPDPEFHIALADSFQHPAVRQAALRTLNTPQLREASIRLLATQDTPMTPERAQAAYPVLAKAAAVAPEAVVLDLLADVPGDRGAPLLVRALGSGDADAVVTAFAALSDLNPQRAQADLLAAFKASPPDRAGVWVQALERAGMTVPTFDAIAFGHAALRDTQLAPHQRAVGLHTAMLYPAGEKGRVAGRVDDLLPILVTLPVSGRLATTAASHPAMQTPRAMEALLSVWQDQDTEAAAEFARALGRARPASARPLLRGLFARSSDYRVQIAAVQALAAIGREDADWIATATRAHPIRAVQIAGAKASGRPAPRALPGCRPNAPLLKLEAERMPYFQSGRYVDGTPAKRWQLNDARAIPGGWLGGYEGGLIRYSSAQDTAEATTIAGDVVAVLPDVVPEIGKRATLFWVVERTDRAARLHRYEVDGPPSAPTALPGDVRVVALGEGARARFKGRGWALAFADGDAGGEQATLVVTREGRIVPVCAEPAPGPYTPPRL